MSMEWLAVTGLAVTVAGGTGVLVWLVMHLHLQLAVLRERETHWRASLAPPAAPGPLTVPEQWFEARLASVLVQLADQRIPVLPALPMAGTPEPTVSTVIEPAPSPKPTLRRRSKQTTQPARKRSKCPSAEAR